MFNAARKTIAAVGVLAAAAAGGSAIAGAAGGSSSGSGQRTDEKPLTGETAERVKAAALARVEGGTVIRVETDADHGSPYEAHVRKSDGTEVEVLVNEDFEVTAVNEMGARGPGGHHGPGFGGPGLGALARELGVSRARVRDALEAVRPAGRPDKGSLAADLAKALGVEQSAVQEILDANRPSGPRERGGHSDLIEALASGLKIDEAKVEAAFEQLHEDRHGEFAAALAKQLGLDAERVENALEATRPAAPRRP
jgi:hypothetical protein